MKMAIPDKLSIPLFSKQPKSKASASATKECAAKTESENK
jgi:hypothetical protein